MNKKAQMSMSYIFLFIVIIGILLFNGVGLSSFVTQFSKPPWVYILLAIGIILVLKNFKKK